MPQSILGDLVPVLKMKAEAVIYLDLVLLAFYDSFTCFVEVV